MTRSEGCRPTGLVLAGGQSSRLGVPDKALAELNGRPMLQHVLERLRGQASPILLSVHRSNPDLAAFGLEQVVDVVERRRGPLTGLVSGLLRLECRGGEPWLLLVPCDAPLLPADLSSQLMRAALDEQKSVAVARFEGVVQPVFSLWHLDALPRVKPAVLDADGAGLMRVLDQMECAIVDWPASRVSPFVNVNTPQDLAEAAGLVDLVGEDS